MPADLQILPAEQINKSKWDQCIESAENGLIYSRYDYLDAMCDNWHGLVINDYETVMAMPCRKKFGIRYFYEPAFTQQLGLIGNELTDHQNILHACFSFASYGDLLFNFNNNIVPITGLTRRTNLVLELSVGYDLLSSNYKKDLQQNLKKSEKANLAYIDGDIHSAVAAYRLSYQNRLGHIRETDYRNFEDLSRRLSENKKAFTKKVVGPGGELLCIALFLEDDKRIYNIMNTTTDAGRNTEANHFLLDRAIQEFSGENLLFDFEGSDLPGVKSFYEKFGAKDQPYYHYHFNRLPFPLRLLKR
jgi:hypothetical protein